MHLVEIHLQRPLPIMGEADQGGGAAAFLRIEGDNEMVWSQNPNKSEIYKNLGKRGRGRGRYVGIRLPNIIMLPLYLQSLR